MMAAVVSPLVWGQADVGRIAGTVTDSTGAVVPKATITVSSEKTGLTRKAEVNEQGQYLINQLPPASYNVKAQAPGMAVAEYSGVPLQVGQERTLNVTLQPSTVTTEVNVSGGDLTVIDVSSAAVGANIGSREVARSFR